MKKNDVSGPVSAIRAGVLLLILAVISPVVVELILPTENPILIVIAAIAGIFFYFFSFIFLCLGIVLIVGGAVVFGVRWTKLRCGACRA